ncbi:MAG TPA: IclR family transcriptional regulator C-terminal domain-containing protein, partial [Burkholderiaceae bacterium]|nr:IclR family transcriptional regulator C-terminal domain-containing protein [Burkholderiaceae bacterium]
RPLHVTMRAGTVMSLLGTSTGRAFAAVMRPECLEKAMGSALGDPDGRKLALIGDDAEALRGSVAEFREHGLTRAVGRPIPSVNAFSAVAFDHEGEPAIVITALGHEDSFPSGWDSDVADAVRAAATEISHRLGWRGKPLPAARNAAASGAAGGRRITQPSSIASAIGVSPS